jgi:hypothetical protein
MAVWTASVSFQQAGDLRIGDETPGATVTVDATLTFWGIGGALPKLSEVLDRPSIVHNELRIGQ